MIDHATIPAHAICDGCGVSAETIESRSKRDELIQGNLPAGWSLVGAAHLCGGCLINFVERAA